MDGEALDAEEKHLVGRQLGREVRGSVMVASRCVHGVIQVIATPPFLPDGTPFPTLYWLTCPLLRRAVSRLESGSYRELIRRRLRDDTRFAGELGEAERRYAEDRRRWAEAVGDARKAARYFSGRAGIGGSSAGSVKCLHAHLAHFLAGGDNPVGEVIAEELAGLQEKECAGDCPAYKA